MRRLHASAHRADSASSSARKIWGINQTLSQPSAAKEAAEAKKYFSKSKKA